MEQVNPKFWSKKKVFLTGHTGFKGSWLAIWLQSMGASVYGYSLAPDTNPNLYEAAGLKDLIAGEFSDIRDLPKLKNSIKKFAPDVVIHMAAQPLVRRSYRDPLETITTNVVGTAHILEAVRDVSSVKSCLVITTDKVYENKGLGTQFKESDPLGGYDPYSCSKACAEIVTSSWRNSFLHKAMSVASARAGNVIGGGDWSEDRLIPDIIKHLLQNKTISIRSPKATRPWQHVLEPLSGYLLLAQKMYEDSTLQKYSQAWNFGPHNDDALPVLDIVTYMQKLAPNLNWTLEKNEQPHEAAFLSLDISKSLELLKWAPRLDIQTALQMTLDWYQAFDKKENALQLCKKQIDQYQRMA